MLMCSNSLRLGPDQRPLFTAWSSLAILLEPPPHTEPEMRTRQRKYFGKRKEKACSYNGAGESPCEEGL